MSVAESSKTEPVLEIPKVVETKQFDPSIAIKAMVGAIKSVPKESEIQIEMFMKYYKRLIIKMDEYEWMDLLEEGVKIKEKEDAKVFIAQITKAPLELKVTYTDPEKPSEIKITVSKNAHSLLVLKLRSMGVYVGPLGVEMTMNDGKNDIKITNPLSLEYNESTRVLKLVYK